MLMDYLLEPENILKASIAWNKSTIEQRKQFLCDHSTRTPELMECAKKKWKKLPSEIQSIILTHYKPLIL